MLYINKIKKNKEGYVDRLKIKNFDAIDLFNNVISKDDKRKETQQNTDKFLAKGNQLAKQIGELYKRGKINQANALKIMTEAGWE